MYYHNTLTNETSWMKPEHPELSSAAKAMADHLHSDHCKTEGSLPPDWEEHHDVDGTVYYYHVASGAVTWTHPCETGSARFPKASEGQRYSGRV